MTGNKSTMLANMNVTVASGRHDPFFDLIKTCKKDNLSGGRAFIRSINVDSGYVLALDSQLHDLLTFCTD